MKRAAFENSGARLLDIVTGIEKNREAIAAAKKVEKEAFGRAESDGYDKKALKAVLKQRAETDEGRLELFRVVDTYLETIELAENVTD